MRSIASKTAPLALAVLTSCLFSAPGRAADEARIKAAVDEAFQPLLKEYDAPGMAVGVTVGGEHFFFSYGLASKKDKTPVTKDTLFELGSISKTFTAVLGSYAEVQGKLSLSDHPARFMPALEGSALDKATLLHFATYTPGGLPLQFPGEVTSNGAMERYFRAFEPSAEPGAVRRYSNPSIGLFGHVTALAMGGNYADLVEREILPKLGLEHTFIRVPNSAMADYAWGTDRAGKPKRVGPGVLDAEAYGVKSSAADMLRYLDLNMQPEKLDGHIRQAVEATHVGYFKIGPMVQGLGWEQYDWPVALDELLAGNDSTMSQKPNPATALNPPKAPSGPTLFNKTGSTAGFGAYAVFVPERKIGLVMLANRGFPIPARVKAAYKVLEELDRQTQ